MLKYQKRPQSPSELWGLTAHFCRSNRFGNVEARIASYVLHTSAYIVMPFLHGLQIDPVACFSGAQDRVYHVLVGPAVKDGSRYAVTPPQDDIGEGLHLIHLAPVWDGQLCKHMGSAPTGPRQAKSASLSLLWSSWYCRTPSLPYISIKGEDRGGTGRAALRPGEAGRCSWEAPGAVRAADFPARARTYRA